MTRFAYILLFSLILSCSTFTVSADNHHRGNGRGNDRKEIRHDNRDKKKKQDKHRKEIRKEAHKEIRKETRKEIHRHDKAPQRPVHYGYAPGHRPHNLGHIVRKAAHGGRDIMVWQVDYNTYIVKYRVGKKYYTRYFYPYDNRIGAPVPIGLNWAPMQPWSLVPSVQLNINL